MFFCVFLSVFLGVLECFCFLIGVTVLLGRFYFND